MFHKSFPSTPKGSILFYNFLLTFSVISFFISYYKNIIFLRIRTSFQDLPNNVYLFFSKIGKQNLPYEQKAGIMYMLSSFEKCWHNNLWLHSFSPLITVQRYTQIVTGRYARCVYLVFVFTMLILWKWDNIGENSYFSRNRQNRREYRIPCSQKCPNFSREIQVQT